MTTVASTPLRGQDLAAEEELSASVERLVAQLASPLRSQRLDAQLELLALPESADEWILRAAPPGGFEPRAALEYVRAHRPRAARPVRVPAGGYRLGSSFPPDQNPEREVQLREFWIDDVEVTCFEWWRFVRSGGGPPPPSWIGARHPFGGERIPVGDVAPDEAERFARWVGGRLPTSDEWEAAAHGGDPRPYPWGDEFEGHLSGSSLRTFFTTALPPEVGSEVEDVSPFGARDFCASLTEWVTLDDGGFAARGGSYKAGSKDQLRLTRAPDPRFARRRDVSGLRVVDRGRDGPGRGE